MPAIATAVKQVPFTTREWSRVRELYNSKSSEELRECLDIIAMWNCRLGDANPLFVSCTDFIMRLALEEVKVQEQPTVHTKDTLKLLYGICCVRFVNFVNEIGQSTALKLLPMAQSLSQMGLPSWIVDIRHGVAHGHYPSIHALRRFHVFARKWLWNNVWNKPMDTAVLKVGVAENVVAEKRNKWAQDKEHKMEEAISYFITERLKNREPAYTHEVSATIPFVIPLRKHLDSDPYDLLRVLVKDGFLILSEKQLETAQLEEKGIVSKALQSFWQPILILIMHKHLAAEFLIALLTRLSQQKETIPSSITQLVEWSHLILDTYTHPDSTVFTSSEWTRILGHLITGPQHFSSSVVRRVMNKLPSLRKERRRQIEAMLKITSAEQSSSTETNDDEVKTLADLQRLIGGASDDADASEEKPSSVWELCDPDAWVGVPLGLTPYQTYESLSLIIDPNDL